MCRRGQGAPGRQNSACTGPQVGTSLLCVSEEQHGCSGAWGARPEMRPERCAEEGSSSELYCSPRLFLPSHPSCPAPSPAVRPALQPEAPLQTPFLYTSWVFGHQSISCRPDPISGPASRRPHTTTGDTSPICTGQEPLSLRRGACPCPTTVSGRAGPLSRVPDSRTHAICHRRPLQRLTQVASQGS